MASSERPDQTPTSPRSDRVRAVAGLAGRSARRRSGRFRVEGPQAVRSLLTHRPGDALEVFLTAEADAAHPELAEAGRAARVPVRTVTAEVLGAMLRESATAPATGPDSGARPGERDEAMVTPQGVLAVARLHREMDWRAALASALPRAGKHDGPVTIAVLHEVRDPGNVGAVIRVADAAGADLVVLTRGSADPYSPKVVRASAGSLFHLPVVPGAEMPELLAELEDRGITAVATSGRAEHDLYDAEVPHRCAWILGNEARGLDERTLAATSSSIRIPLLGAAESLNVATAAALCFYESLRRRRT
ncbi:MAG: RNA methyltransferase [Brachybacterium sp.]|nr:RNA methyltransferase [Brachybacterium sp.]